MLKKIISCIAICLVLALALSSCDILINSPVITPTYQYNDEFHWTTDGGEERPHTFNDGVCTVCGCEKPEGDNGGEGEGEVDENPSKLDFTEYDTYAVVTGIGKNTDKHLVIPSTYNGKPVTEIAYRGLGNGMTAPQYETITIPDSITYIGDEAFAECLRVLHIGKGLADIEDWTFWNSFLIEEITVDEENPNFKVVDNVLYSKDGKTLVKYLGQKPDTEFTVPAGVEHIGAYSFHSCKNLTNIVLPEGLKTIGKGAFCWSDHLETINIPEGVTTVGDAVFGYTALTEVIFPDSVTSIGSDIFHYVEPLRRVHLGAGLETFPEALLCSIGGQVELTISEDNPYFVVIENVVYNRADMSVVLENVYPYPYY